MEAVATAAAEFGIEFNLNNLKIMTDFELAILNSCHSVFPNTPRTCCFFHLGQSVYRHIQEAGLQQAYSNRGDRSVRTHTHMLLALAFIPVVDVQRVFAEFQAVAPEALLVIFTYFGETYVNGRPGRGRRRAVPPRYPVPLWNQYEAALTGDHRTNNVSEGWHNRFHLIVGKNHPDLYSLLKEIQKEQADSESMIAELALGRAVKSAPKKKWIQLQNRIRFITRQYQEYARENRILDYLNLLGNNFTL